MPAAVRKSVPSIAPSLAPLSALHAMLEQIDRHFDARWINRVSNDPDVFNQVRGNATEPLDLSAVVADPDNICLGGAYGVQFYTMLQPGLFEVHTSILPEGRGDWSVAFVRACLHWVFTRTNAVEIVTRCPSIPAKALARAINGRFEFTNPQGWILDGKPVPADIYSLTIQEWMKTAPGLEERGRWFHDRLDAEFERHGREEPQHPDDEAHDRYVGAACEMILAGQPGKGVLFYNRWAALADYAQVSITMLEPLTIDIANAFLIVPEDGEFWVASIH